MWSQFFQTTLAKIVAGVIIASITAGASGLVLAYTTKEKVDDHGKVLEVQAKELGDLKERTAGLESDVEWIRRALEGREESALRRILEKLEKEGG